MNPVVVEAVYENGVLKPARPLPLKEKEHVRLTVEPDDDPVGRTYGLLHWTGDPETLRRFALDPALDPQEGP